MPLQVPNIPPAVMAKAKQLHDTISQKSSAQQFACVQYAVDEANQRLHSELGLDAIEPHEQVCSFMRP